jgi:hypothetical protein
LFQSIYVGVPNKFSYGDKSSEQAKKKLNFGFRGIIKEIIAECLRFKCNISLKDTLKREIPDTTHKCVKIK